MADYNSTYTGAEVDAAVAKSLALEPANEINEAIAPASASSGAVWTADGEGGAAWAIPSSGGGTQLYLHTITDYGGVYGAINIITTDSTPKSTFIDVYYMWHESLACYIAGIASIMYAKDTTHIATARWNGLNSSGYGTWNGADNVLNTHSVTDTVTPL